MFLIRRIHDHTLPINQMAIREVQEIFKSQFPDAQQDDVLSLANRLSNPFLKRFRTVLLVAENARHHVLGFAILLHEPELGFSYLDFMASGKKITGRGVGAALYEHVREQANDLGSKGLFYECLPSDEDRCGDAKLRKVNASRLKFYEAYGARPLIGTGYETPVPDGSSDSLPHLMFDDLDSGKLPKASFVKQVIRAILERKYREICPQEYVERIVNSVVDDPVQLREFRFLKGEADHRPASLGEKRRFTLVLNDKHDIHHIRERGYVESPVRIPVITSELNKSDFCTTVPTREYPLKHILAVHDTGLVDYLERACKNAPEGKSVYPYVFPIRNATRPPKDLSVRAGYYCIDTFTPINRNAFPAAKRAVDASLTAADAILDGGRLAYALVRPPGHHAEHRSFGGFCYFCNAAVAANYFSSIGKVAILDIDYHHGNGQQDIFYERSDVFTVSIHGDPDFAYPYFTGFSDEVGRGPGEGFNLNIALPEHQDGKQYRRALARALEVIRGYEPEFLVVCLGLDPAKGDPTGTWSLVADDFTANGRMIGELNLPTLVVQEGGYRTRTLGINARCFFSGVLETQDR
ncbi:MAG: acetylpolyamine amidohydrolase [Planctomycetales bacterium]|nr:acetylpolyamine amidohydrolase [Planctomycetales bacterium]